MPSYLGDLPGMTFDPVRRKYFPTPRDTPTEPPPTAGPSTDRRQPPTHIQLQPQPERTPPRPRIRTGHVALVPTVDQVMRHGPAQHWMQGRVGGSSSDSGSKRAKMEVREDLPGMRKGRALRGRPLLSGASRASTTTERMEKELYTSQYLQETHYLCTTTCHSESITSYKAFNGGTYYATTDHGQVIVSSANGEHHHISICSDHLVGMHTDIARLTNIAISGGSEPHLHHFRCDPENLEVMHMQHTSLDLKPGDIHAFSSFDDVCTLGGTKSLTTISYTKELKATRRKLPSDALAVHQADHNIVFAGLRSSDVILEDLRVSPKAQHCVGKMQKGKAVVGVRRLKDSAVPWGLLASGMGSELLLFDIRFSDKPLKTLKGHVNTFYQSLGFTTTPDDRYIFAAGSDNRLRGWSTVTGEPIISPHITGPVTSACTSSLGIGSSKVPKSRLSALAHQAQSQLARYQHWDPRRASASGGDDDREWDMDIDDDVDMDMDEESDSEIAIVKSWTDDTGAPAPGPGGQARAAVRLNPLTEVFGSRIKVVEVRDDGGLDVASGGVLYRFGRNCMSLSAMEEETGLEESVW